MPNEIKPIVNEIIVDKIYVIRDQKVMLDRDLSQLYNVETKRLKEAVRRNISRFPADFMFELSKTEFDNWRSQFASSNSDKLGLRYAPMAFTEHGVLMLSSVLNSESAIQTNIQIMRMFSKIKQHFSDVPRFVPILKKSKTSLKTKAKTSNWFFSTWMNCLRRKTKRKEQRSVTKNS